MKVLNCLLVLIKDPNYICSFQITFQKTTLGNVSVHKICHNCELQSLVSDSSRPFSFRSAENVFIIKLIFEFRSVTCDTKSVIDYVIFSLFPPPVNNSRNKDVICRYSFNSEPFKAPNTTIMLSNQLLI